MKVTGSQTGVLFDAGLLLVSFLSRRIFKRHLHYHGLMIRHMYKYQHIVATSVLSQKSVVQRRTNYNGILIQDTGNRQTGQIYIYDERDGNAHQR